MLDSEEALSQWDGSGKWRFDNLSAGSYVVRFIPDSGTIIGASSYVVNLRRGQVVAGLAFAKF